MSQRPFASLIVVLILASASSFAATAAPAGALIQMKSTSTVGVLLDEIPAGALREQAAANALAKPAEFWIARARNQVRLMNYRLVFRSGFHAIPSGNSTKTYGPLPLTPQETWIVTLQGAPYRAKINGHDLVVVDYAFNSVIVSDADSPAKVDPNLGTIGGTASETFNLPADPELLFERTGYACMDEDEFPPGSVFEENTWYFYDDTCTGGTSSCHVSVPVSGSCVNALVNEVGRVRSTIGFARIPYDAAIADAFRVGTVNPEAISAGAAADLAVVTEGMSNERAFTWRFFGPGSCELGEGVIGSYGWRRLLAFSAIVRNDGTAAIDLGDVSDPANPYVASNAFEYSACHHHYHFSHYGTFTYAGGTGSKRAFCLEDTNRYHNDETTPLTASHQTCANQGVGAGWGDEYNFGIPGQWVDVTGKDTSNPQPLSFLSNPDQFLCEGTLVRDANGNLIFDATSFTNLAGETEYRVRCNFLNNWNTNNLGVVSVASPGGSFVTDACTRGQVGPNRSCGFAAGLGANDNDVPHPCTTARNMNLSCRAIGGAPAVVRVCEVSGQNGVGVACTADDSLANVIVGPTATPVQFACPAVRDAAMSSDPVPVPLMLPGVGGYSIYRAAIGTLGASDSSPPSLICTGG
jgi:hypothetical protein